MNQEQISDLKKTLLDNYLQIVSLVFDPQKDHKKNYRVLSIFLFNSLIDDSCPMIIKLSEEMNKPLMIVAYDYYNKDIDYSKCVFDYNGQKTMPHWPLYIDGPVVPIQSYLDQVIGVIPFDEKTGEQYTPRKIIRHLRNKDIAHFEKTKPKYYQALKGFEWHDNDVIYEGFIIQNVIYSLSYWLVTATIFLLCQGMFNDQLKEKQRKGEFTRYIDLEKMNRIFDYQFITNRYDTTIFCGNYFLSTTIKEEFIDNFLGISTLIMFPETSINSTNCIFEIGLSQTSMFSIAMLKKNDDEIIIRIGDIEKDITIKELGIDLWKYHAIHLLLLKFKETWCLSIVIDSTEVLKIPVHFLEKNKRIFINEFKIGNFTKEENGTIFLCNEIVAYKDQLLNENLSDLSNSLWLIPFNRM